MKKTILCFCICCCYLTSCSKVVEEENGIKKENVEVQEAEVTRNDEKTPLETQKEQEESVFSIEFLGEEAVEGMAYLDKLGFAPFLFEDYLPFCQVPNGIVYYTAYDPERSTWMGDIFGEDGAILEVFSDDLVYFYSKEGEKYQLTRDGFQLSSE